MKRFAFIVSLVVAALGCGGLPKPEYPHTDALHALTLHRLMRERVTAIQAEARVDQRGAEGRVRGTVLMFVQRPARVRFDAITQFGPAAIVTMDGDTFQYNDLRNGRYQTGRTCPENIARLLSLPMTVQQATLLLLGGTALIPHERSSIVWDDEGFYRIELFGAAKQRQRIDLAVRRDDLGAPADQQRLRLLRSELFDSEGKSQFRATYGDYRVMQTGRYGIAMPFEVRVVQRSSGTDTLIRFKDIRFESDVPPEAFVQKPRAGASVEVLECD